MFGAVALDTAKFHVPVRVGVQRRHVLRVLAPARVAYRGRKIFLIIDNGPCHRLDDNGKRWLRRNRYRIELRRLPPYSPEFMAMEGVWKTTRKLTTHNAFFVTRTSGTPS